MRIVERLTEDSARFDSLATGFKHIGDRELARKATYAAQALAAAAKAVTIYQDAVAASGTTPTTPAPSRNALGDDI